MQKFIQMLVVLVCLVSVMGCQVATINQTAYPSTSVKNRVQKSSPVGSVSGLEVFRNQPAEPTQAALRNCSTWGEINGDALGWNELRPSPRAKLQKIQPETRVLVDAETGYQWKEKCYNRILPESSQAQQEEGGGCVINNTINNGPNPFVEIVKVFFGSLVNVVKPDIRLNIAGGEGGCRQYQQQRQVRCRPPM